MPLDFETLKERIASGIAFYIGARVTREISERFSRKYLKEHGDAVTGVGISFIAEFMKGSVPEKVRTYVDDIIDAASDYGIYREIKVLAEKEPVCWAQDQNTIVCANIDDLENAEIFLDGQKLTKDTDYTVSGNQIQLKNPMSKGGHTLVIVDGTGKKSFSGKVYA